MTIKQTTQPVAKVKETTVTVASNAEPEATVVLSDLDKMAKEKHQKKKADSIAVNSGESPSPTPSSPGINNNAQFDVAALVSQAVADALAQREAQDQARRAEEESKAQLAAYEAETAKAKAEAERAQKEAQEAQAQLANLAGALKLQGMAAGYNPNVLAQLTSRSDKMGSTLQSFMDGVSRAPKITKTCTDKVNGEMSWMQPDSRVVDRLLRQQIHEARQSTGCKFLQARDFEYLPLFQEYEDYLRRNGLFQGKGAPMLNAGAISADIVGGFLTTLSAMMRYTHRGNYIWHQFAPVEMNFAAGNGDTIVVPRYALAANTDTLEDWELSGGGTFVSITDNRQNATTGTTPIVIKEYGMGKPGVPENVPFMVPNFVQQYSMISVLSIFDIYLMRNYMIFEDIAIQSLYLPTSVVYYNNTGEIETDPTALTTGDDGTLSVEFLRSLDSDMKAKYIPTYRDGRYVIVIDDYSLQQLRESMSRVEKDQFVQPTTEAEMINLTNILTAIEGVDRITGYHGVIGSFHIFSQNTWGMGAAGTRGVQEVTIAGSVDKDFRSCYAFGADAVARGMGMPMEIRSRSGEILWERAQEFAWFSHEAFAPLDVDPVGYNDTSDVPQQLRVIECRFCTTKL